MTNYLLIIILIVGFAVVIFLLMKRKDGNNGEKLAAMMERLASLAEQNRELRQAMDGKLAETHRATTLSLVRRGLWRYGD